MEHSTNHDHGEGAHVVSVRLLATILGILLALTVLTVAVTYVDLGMFSLFVALLIALVKATLVGLYFMHLRWDRPFNAIVLVISLLMVVLFIGLTLMDTQQYQPDMIPGYAPDLTR